MHAPAVTTNAGTVQGGSTLGRSATGTGTTAFIGQTTSAFTRSSGKPSGRESISIGGSVAPVRRARSAAAGTGGYVWPRFGRAGANRDRVALVAREVAITGGSFSTPALLR